VYLLFVKNEAAQFSYVNVSITEATAVSIWGVSEVLRGFSEGFEFFEGFEGEFMFFVLSSHECCEFSTSVRLFLLEFEVTSKVSGASKVSRSFVKSLQLDIL